MKHTINFFANLPTSLRVIAIIAIVGALLFLIFANQSAKASETGDSSPQITEQFFAPQVTNETTKLLTSPINAPPTITANSPIIVIRGAMPLRRRIASVGPNPSDLIVRRGPYRGGQGVTLTSPLNDSFEIDSNGDVFGTMAATCTATPGVFFLAVYSRATNEGAIAVLFVQPVNMFGLSCPTAATANIGGRAVNDEGLPLADVRISAFDASTNETSVTSTDIDGKYGFDNFVVGHVLQVTAAHDSYSFSPPNYFFTHLEERNDLNFTAIRSSADALAIRDFDRDGKAGNTVFRPEESVWSILQSPTTNLRSKQ